MTPEIRARCDSVRVPPPTRAPAIWEPLPACTTCTPAVPGSAGPGGAPTADWTWISSVEAVWAADRVAGAVEDDRRHPHERAEREAPGVRDLADDVDAAARSGLDPDVRHRRRHEGLRQALPDGGRDGDRRRRAALGADHLAADGV